MLGFAVLHECFVHEFSFWTKFLPKAKVKKALLKSLSVAETVELTGISISTIERYRKHLQAALS